MSPSPSAKIPHASPRTHVEDRPRWGAQPLATVLVIAGILLAGSPASAAEYRPDRAGNPVRILAYVVHPVGVVLDYVIMRPAFWVGSHEPFRTLVGRSD